MEGETSNQPTEIDNGSRRSETPKPLSQQRSQPSTERRSLDDVITHPSTAAIHEFASLINQSAMDEARKTVQFRQELRRRLFRVAVGTYAWSSARLAYETDLAERKLEQGVGDLLSAGQEQGRSSHPPPTLIDRARARLAELFAAVNKAVAAFVHT